MKKTAIICLLLVLLLGCGQKSSQLVKTQNELVAAHEKIDALEQELASMHAALEQTEQEIAELQPIAAKAREMPVRTRITKAVYGNGSTLWIFNSSRRPLQCSFTVGASGETHPFAQVIEGGKAFPLHHLASGVVVKISSEGFDTTATVIP